MIPARLLDRLSRHLEGGDAGSRVISVEAELDPLELVWAGAALHSTAVYLGRPGAEELGGLGTAWRYDAAGTERFAELARASEELGVEGGRLVFGASFAPAAPGPDWPGLRPASAVLPAVAAVRSPAGSRLLVAPGRSASRTLEALSRLPPPSFPDRPPDSCPQMEEQPEAWRGVVERALDAIGSTELRKVVLARSATVRSPSLPDPFAVVDRLRSPEAWSFGWQEGAVTLVGASPELLASRRGPVVISAPLAGSAPRGSDAIADDRLAEGLLASGKDLEEHRLVVEDVAGRLGEVLDDLEVIGPRVERAPGVQHLGSEVRGRLRTPRSVIELAGMLHPTPAVGGVPRAEALAFIDRFEGLDRGWYAGVLGWMDGEGDGEALVTLRCALLEGGRARVYAGAGIVEGSDPDAELIETRLKMAPLLDLLTGGR